MGRSYSSIEAATFGDVPTIHQFVQLIETLAASGITSGSGGAILPVAALGRGAVPLLHRWRAISRTPRRSEGRKPGWREHSLFVDRLGVVDVYHYDPYSQALGKIERGYDRDLADVQAMLERGQIESSRLRELYEEARPQIVRFPAVDPEALEARPGDVLDD